MSDLPSRSRSQSHSSNHQMRMVQQAYDTLDDTQKDIYRRIVNKSTVALTDESRVLFMRYAVDISALPPGRWGGEINDAIARRGQYAPNHKEHPPHDTGGKSTFAVGAHTRYPLLADPNPERRLYAPAKRVERGKDFTTPAKHPPYRTPAPASGVLEESGGSIGRGGNDSLTSSSHRAPPDTVGVDGGPGSERAVETYHSSRAGDGSHRGGASDNPTSSSRRAPPDAAGADGRSRSGPSGESVHPSRAGGSSHRRGPGAPTAAGLPEGDSTRRSGINPSHRSRASSIVGEPRGSGGSIHRGPMSTLSHRSRLTSANAGEAEDGGFRGPGSERTGETYHPSLSGGGSNRGGTDRAPSVARGSQRRSGSVGGLSGSNRSHSNR